MTIFNENVKSLFKKGIIPEDKTQPEPAPEARGAALLVTFFFDIPNYFPLFCSAKLWNLFFKSVTQ
ncbi:MAG: hypothetical protein J5939_02875 [Bacteroidales bacterium]|nr:hypothetical protein [Bacteroidales bacterium]